MALTYKQMERMMEVLQGSVQTSHSNFGPLGYADSLLLVIKGRGLEYSKNLEYVASMDLLGNNFSRDIPRELANLYGLQNLNLTGNKLAGKIPENIGQLKWLESLDLSRNNLLGSIPSSMSLWKTLAAS
ncbi:hypothetical protein J5N97_023134 [Dioscorea zingiberensis]|uniref:Uncharacterized protein n=1 Tax=Dioscorea zingiberensis TaxID=325984 RepID=A0A9D5CCU1_9LILI|nr:hypothetical protein J5N97_023134 [Dioscorea zingiberensis]